MICQYSYNYRIKAQSTFRSALNHDDLCRAEWLVSDKGKLVRRRKNSQTNRRTPGCLIWAIAVFR